MKRLAINSIWNVTALIVSLVVGFVTTPIVFSLLGANHYGLWVLLLSILFPLGLTNLSFGQATIKYVAEAHGRKDLQEASTYVQTTFLFNLVVGIIGAVAIILLAPWLTIHVFNIDIADHELARQCLIWLGIGWFIQQFLQTFSNLPIGLQRYDIVAIGNILQTLVTMGVSLLILYLTKDLLNFVQSRITVQLLAACAWFFVAKWLLPGVSLLPTWHKIAFQRSFQFSTWQTIGQLGGMAALQIDKYILGILLSTSAVGFYDIAMTVQKYAYTLGNRFGEVLFPAFSYMSAANDRQREALLLVRSTWFLTTASMAIMVPVFVLAGDFLSLWVGPEIAISSSHLLQVLALAGILGSASNAGMYYLLGKGKTQWSALISMSTGIVILGISLLMVPQFGMQGAGWGNVVAMFIQALAVTFMWHHFFGNELSFSVYMSALYGPVVTALLMCVLLSIAKATITLQLGWLSFAMSVFIGSSTTILAIIGIDRFLPGGEIRQQDIRRLTHRVTLYFATSCFGKII